MKKKLVIFDMDGVLIDSERMSDACWQITLSDHNIAFSDEKRSQLVGMSIENADVFFKEEIGSTYTFDQLKEYQINVQKEYVKKHPITVKEGILDLIKTLKEHEINIAVASSTTKQRGIDRLKQSGLYGMFDYYIFGDMVQQTKPNPEIFLKVVEHFNYDNKETVVFEDSYYGVKAANNANIDVVWLKDMVDIDKMGDVFYIEKFTSAQQAISLIQELI